MNLTKELALQQSIWKGYVSIQFQMSTHDIASLYPPMSINLLINRFAYLGSIAYPAIKYFQSIAIEFSDDIWFESYEQKLNSNLPIGVLYDCIVHHIPLHTPWIITIHFQPMRDPSVSVELIGMKQLERIFFHTMKQSLQLLYGTTRLFHELTVESQMMIWNATKEGHLEQYRQMITPLLAPILTISSAQSEDTNPHDKRILMINETIKHLPIRIIVHRENTTQFLLQKRIKPYQLMSENDETTGDTSRLGERTIKQMLLEDFSYSQEQITQIEWRSHGIQVPIDMPIDIFWKLFHYADLFCYIVMIPKNS